MNIREALIAIRTYKGISAKTLSTKLGFHKSYISKIEEGEIEPTAEKLLAIYQGLELPEELINLLVVDKDKISDSKKELYDALAPIFTGFIIDITTNKNLKAELLTQHEEPKHYTLVMKGGGIKGIAYVGALEELSRFYSFNWFAGTSAGGISAVLLGCGYSIQELKDILLSKNFSDFRDGNIWTMLFNLLVHGGLYKANKFSIWISRLLAEKLNSPTDVTLKELPFRTTVYASKKNSNALIFDSKKPETENISAAFAARCSMSVPFIFTPQKDQGLNVYDGGLQNNYPISQILDEDPEIKFIGLYLGNPIFDKATESNNLFKDIFSIWGESSDIASLKKYKDKTIVIDPRPITTFQFKLNNPEKEYLLESGRLSAKKYLKKEKLLNISNKELNDNEILLLSLRKSVIKKKRRKILIRCSIIVVGVVAFYCFKLFFL